MHTPRIVNADLSEVGRTCLLVECTIEFDHYAGCRQTYDSPAEPEWGFVRDVTVNCVTGADWEITRQSRPDWLAFAEACVANKLDDVNALRFTRDYERC